MKTTIYLTRHGQTEWNIEKRLQGRGNSPLTQEGIARAEELSKRIKDLGIEMIYTSSIERAKRTAYILRGEENIEIIEDEGLVEMSFGEYEGQLIEEAIAHNPEWNLYEVMEGNQVMCAPGGERLLDVYKRVKETMDTMIDRHLGKTILVVTHGMTLKALMQYFEEEDCHKTVMGQATLTKIEIDEENIRRIIFKNDSSHFLTTQGNKGW